MTPFDTFDSFTYCPLPVAYCLSLLVACGLQLEAALLTVSLLTGCSFDPNQLSIMLAFAFVKN
jgi:hypothetical protein